MTSTTSEANERTEVGDRRKCNAGVTNGSRVRGRGVARARGILLTIEIEIKGSDVTIDAIGFTGDACELETREVEEALGVVVARTKKPEYFANLMPPATVRAIAKFWSQILLRDLERHPPRPPDPPLA